MALKREEKTIQNKIESSFYFVTLLEKKNGSRKLGFNSINLIAVVIDDEKTWRWKMKKSNRKKKIMGVVRQTV